MLAGSDGSRLAVSLRDELWSPHIGHPDLNRPEALLAQALAMFAYPLSCTCHTNNVTCNNAARQPFATRAFARDAFLMAPRYSEERAA